MNYQPQQGQDVLDASHPSTQSMPFPSPGTKPYPQHPNQQHPVQQDSVSQANVPPPMRFSYNQILNAATNQPLYAYNLTTAPDSAMPDSLLQLQHLPTGSLVGETKRSGAAADNDPTGCCNFLRCFSPSPDEDIISVGGRQALICDASVGRDCWAWKPTWFAVGGMEEWTFRKEKGVLILRNAVAGGEAVLRVEKGGEVRFSERGMVLNEVQVGEVLLVLVSLRVEREEQRTNWFWELLAW